MEIRKLYGLLYALMAALLLIAGVLAIGALLTQRALGEVQSAQHRSFQLASELRQSSDDLTRFARTYAATGNERYEALFLRTLAIREGQSPRPKQYERIYWDLVPGRGEGFRGFERARSLRERMIDAGLTTQELDKLRQAEHASDALLRIERTAMNAMKGRFADEQGEFTRLDSPDAALAQRLLNGDAYHSAKARVMGPIDEFHDLLRVRTQAEVDAVKRRIDLLLGMLFAVLVMLALCVAAAFVVLRKRITGPLTRIGDEVDDRAQREQFGNPITVAPKGELHRLTGAINRLMQAFEAKRTELARVPEQLERRVEERTRELSQANAELSEQILERRQAQERVQSLTGFYQALSRTGRLIVRERSAKRLFEELCRICVETGHARLAYIATLDGTRATRSAAAGDGVHELPSEWDTSRADVEATTGGQAIATGYRAICADVLADPSEAAWDAQWQLRGVRSYAAFPLRRGGAVTGLMVLYAAKVGFFSGALVELLEEMAEDVSFALDNLDSQVARLAAISVAEVGRAAFQRVFMATPVFAALNALDDLRIVDVNEAICARYGFTRAEMIGKRWAELGVGLPADQRVQIYERLARNDVVRNVECRVVTRSGEWVSVLVNAERVEFAGRDCALLIALDISTLHEAEQARRATAAAEAANRAKTDFLSRMSHEMRTPLNAVVGFSQLLQTVARERLTRPQLEQLEHIHQAGWHLLMLVNDVLDVSRIEAGRVQVDVRPVDLLPLIDEAVRLSEPLAKKSGIVITAAYLRMPPVGVMADPLRLRQVLLNLLSNGVKYNRPGGQVRVEVAVRADRVSIEVVDTGLGMTREQMEHLYEPFNRLGRQRGGIEGTGIGLALSRQIVDLMSGIMEVESQSGHGTRVRVALPRAEAPKAVFTSVPADALPAGDGVQGVVLYIEDNPINMLLVAQLVSHWDGVRLVQAENGASGIEQARELRPDLVLLDMQLPDMTGLEILDAFHADSATRDLRVIAVSANAMQEEVEEARAHGAWDYWTKPLDVNRFLADIGKLLSSKA